MNDLAAITERSTVTLVRSLPGPIERIWAYLTEPNLLAKWFSQGVVADRIGGDVRFEMGPSGRVTVCEPPRLLEYTWNAQESSSCGPVVDSLVRWELAKDGDRVRLTLTHSRLPENEVLGHGAGWHTFVERLSACVDGRVPEPIAELFARYKAEYAKLALPEENHVS
jgi:uncharacterized protein YndB with AHSA1/START domain